jgi:hypothetical protein
MSTVLREPHGPAHGDMPCDSACPRRIWPRLISIPQSLPIERWRFLPTVTGSPLMEPEKPRTVPPACPAGTAEKDYPPLP